jgi:hypothetical protein
MRLSARKTLRSGKKQSPVSSGKESGQIHCISLFFHFYDTYKLYHPLQDLSSIARKENTKKDRRASAYPFFNFY